MNRLFIVGDRYAYVYSYGDIVGKRVRALQYNPHGNLGTVRVSVISSDDFNDHSESWYIKKEDLHAMSYVSNKEASALLEEE